MAVRKTVFTESDAYKWKMVPGLVPFMELEEYAEKLKDVYMLRRENGILEARLHTNGDSLWWGTLPHRAIWQFCVWAGQDHNNEVIIEGGSGKNYFAGIYGDSSADADDEANKGTGFDHDPGKGVGDFWSMYEHQYYDGTNEIEGFYWDLEQPTIGIWHGAAFHSDLFFHKDLTLCTEDAWTTEMHFRINMAPGDGIQIAWRELMGRKRFAYAELTGQIITARKALEYGMINEIQPDLEAAYSRAWEIAELIMLSGTRVTRRITTQILRAPWKQDISWELKGSFATEMWVTSTEHSPHDSQYWHGACAEAEAVIAAEKKGMVVRPRVGEFREEFEIK